MATEPRGRERQRARTRHALLEACRSLVVAGEPLTMGAVAEAAWVSEATAYRYFSGVPPLIREAMTEVWPTPEEALAAVADSLDARVRVAHATEALLRKVLEYEPATRALLAATIGRPGATEHLPGHRFAFIDAALDPVPHGLPAAELTRLKQQLALVVGPDSLFLLLDWTDLEPDAAIARVVSTAEALVAAVIP